MSWETLRKKVLERDKYKCVACGSEENLHVHHLSRGRKKIVPMDCLITMCKECHDIVHQFDIGHPFSSPAYVNPLVKSRIIKMLQRLRDSGYRTFMSIFYSDHAKRFYFYFRIRPFKRGSTWRYRGKKDQKPMVIFSNFVKRIARENYLCKLCRKKIKKDERFYRPRDLKKKRPTFHEKCALGTFHKLE